MMRGATTFLSLVPLSALTAAAQTPVVPAGSVVNAASFDGSEPIAPGSLISIFGTALADGVASADTIPLSATLGSAKVTFTGAAGSFSAPLLYAQPDNPANQVASQINAQVPWELLPPGSSSATVNVIVTRDGISSAPTAVNIASSSPGIFALAGRGFATNFPDNTLAWPANAVAGLTTHPAKAGDALVIYCTGLGPVDSAIADGNNSLDALRRTIKTPSVLIGGINAEVLFSGLSPQFVGTYQLNVIVPAGVTAGDNVALQIVLDGVTTSPTASTIAISQ